MSHGSISMFVAAIRAFPPSYPFGNWDLPRRVQVFSRLRHAPNDEFPRAHCNHALFTWIGSVGSLVIGLTRKFLLFLFFSELRPSFSVWRSNQFGCPYTSFNMTKRRASTYIPSECTFSCMLYSFALPCLQLPYQRHSIWLGKTRTSQPRKDDDSLLPLSLPVSRVILLPIMQKQQALGMEPQEGDDSVRRLQFPLSRPVLQVLPL
jgi:hypothetical protein